MVPPRIKKNHHIKTIAFVLALACTSFSDVVQAVQHTIYLPFIGDSAGVPNELQYLPQIRQARIALSDEAPHTTATGPVVGGAMAHPPEPLRVTRTGGGFSTLTLRSLRNQNDKNDYLHSVELVMRDSDLYVLGFINGSGYFRFLNPDGSTYPRVPRSIQERINAGELTLVDLPMSYDYPDIEGKANISRYYSRSKQAQKKGEATRGNCTRNSIRIRMETLRRDLGVLSDFTRRSATDDQAMTELAGAMVRILTAYVEGMRFHSVANSLHRANADSSPTGRPLDQGGTWDASKNDKQDHAALDTNNWRSISEFGSRSSLSSSDESPTTFTLEYSNGWRSNRTLSSLSAPQLGATRVESWENILAIAHRGAWLEMNPRLVRQGSCPPNIRGKYGRGHRFKRELTEDMAPQDEVCLVEAMSIERLGNTYVSIQQFNSLITNLLADWTTP